MPVAAASWRRRARWRSSAKARPDHTPTVVNTPQPSVTPALEAGTEAVAVSSPLNQMIMGDDADGRGP